MDSAIAASKRAGASKDFAQCTKTSFRHWLVQCEIQVKEKVSDQAKNRAQSGVTYYEVNGQRIPLRQERVQLARV